MKFNSVAIKTIWPELTNAMYTLPDVILALVMGISIGVSVAIIIECIINWPHNMVKKVE